MWNGTEKVYIIGICGISLSAIAKILKSQGHAVAGSDTDMGEMSKDLERAGISVYYGHNSCKLDDYDVVVYSAAIAEDNPEILRAKKLHKKMLSRAQLLGQISKIFKTTIAIAGSHGKTTTTGMISTILINSGHNPTIHIGGNFDKIGGNVRIGDSGIFVTEACEYKDSFLKLKPKISVILGVQADHMDYFKKIENLQNSFNSFASNTKKRGAVIFDAGNKRSVQASKHANCQQISVSGGKKSDHFATNAISGKDGCYSFSYYENGKNLGRIYLSVPGKHNITNALAAIAVARFLGIDFSTIQNSLYEFCGVDRRFQFVGRINGAKVFHDYAHHPTEIKASIAAAREMKCKKLFVVFQPHTFSRTKSFFCRFASALSKADQVVMYPIYPAREQPIKGITSEALSKKINEVGGKSVHFFNYAQIKEFLSDNVASSDMVLILGAGDIVDLTKII